MRLLFEKLVLGFFHLMMTIRVAANPRITAPQSVRYKGIAMLDIRSGCDLKIGTGTTVNSRNFGYHLNMLGPCKFIADRPGGKIIIGNNCRIHGTCIHAYESITIGDNCLIAANTQIFDGNGHEASFDNVENRINTTGPAKPIVIEDSVWIAANVIILPGVRIGRGAIISANSVVTADVPPMSIASGNPATIQTQR